MLFTWPKVMLTQRHNDATTNGQLYVSIHSLSAFRKSVEVWSTELYIFDITAIQSFFTLF